MTTSNPIYAGRCLFNTEALNRNPKYQFGAGVRIVSPSSGGGDEHYCPASDVYMYLSIKDAQELAAYFSAIARRLQGVEA